MSNELIFRNIAGHQGRKLVITPQTAKTEYLSVGYINLSAEVPSVRFSTESEEKMFMCMNGSADVSINGVELTMGLYDGLYVPRDSTIEFVSKGNAAILESSAPVSERYPLKLVRWNDIKDDPKLHASIGPETLHRELYQVMTEHVQAGTIAARTNIQQQRELDELASPRTPRHTRGSVCVFQHAGTGVRYSVGL